MKTNKTIMVRWAIVLICICGLSAEGCCECLSEPAREIKEELSSIIRRIQSNEYMDQWESGEVLKKAVLLTNRNECALLFNGFENSLFLPIPSHLDYDVQAMVLRKTWDAACRLWGNLPEASDHAQWRIRLKALAWEKAQLERIEQSKPDDNRTWTEKWQNPEPLADVRYKKWRRLVRGTNSKFYRNHIRRSVYDAEDDRYTPEFRTWCLKEIEKIIGRPLTDDDIMFKDDVLKRRKEREKKQNSTVAPRGRQTTISP